MEDCPAITLVGETSVSGSLAAMDCHINAAVHIGYDRLFGPGGAFGFALSALLVIYVALIGYGFMTGRTRLTLMMMSPRIISMALVLTFATAWPAYHAIFYGLLMGGPDQVAAALLHVHGSAVMHFAQQLDALFVRFADIARALDDSGAATVATPNGQVAQVAQVAMPLPHSMPVQLFWLSGLCLLVSTLGVLILTRLVLYLLLILGPVFIIFALFPQTRGLFNGWLRTSLVFALAPLLTVLGGTAALMLFAPLLNAIGEDPQGAVKAVQPMVILFMGSLIYCAFLFVLMWVAASLVRDWQASFRGRDATPPVSAAATASASGAAQPTISRDAQTRTEPLVSAINRAQEVAAGAANTTMRASALGLYDPAFSDPGRDPGRAASADRFRRVQGLGQRFRPTRPAAGLTPTKPNTP